MRVLGSWYEYYMTLLERDAKEAPGIEDVEFEEIESTTGGDRYPCAKHLRYGK